jgi:hypothetical protein
MPEVTFKKLTPREVYEKVRRVQAKLELCRLAGMEGKDDPVFWGRSPEVEEEGARAVLEDSSAELAEVWTDIEMDDQKAGAPAESEG